MSDDLERITDRIFRAMEEPGPNPKLHYETVAYLKRAWPTLWEALEVLSWYKHRSGQ